MRDDLLLVRMSFSASILISLMHARVPSKSYSLYSLVTNFMYESLYSVFCMIRELVLGYPYDLRNDPKKIFTSEVAESSVVVAQSEDDNDVSEE